MPCSTDGCSSPHPPSPLPTPSVQHGAEIALVELEPRDRDVWRRRVEQRGQLERGTLDAHKPATWAEVLERVGTDGSESWSDGVSVPLRCRIDSTAEGVAVQDHVDQVLRMLHASGREQRAAAAATLE